MSLPNQAIQTAIQADAALLAQGLLQAPCASFFVPSTAPTCEGVVLMLHGYSAGPWQFAEIAQACATAGLHAYAARLPGHGAQLVGGQESWHELPKTRQAQLYTDCAEAAFSAAHALAQSCGVPLYLFGFSLGGAMTLDLALRHPTEVSRMVLAAPLIRPMGQTPWLLFRSLRIAQRLGGHFLIDRVPLSWGALPAAPPDGWVRPGHWFFRVGNMYAAIDYGARLVLNQAPLKVPTQLFTTANDLRCDPQVAADLLRASSGPHFAFNFPASSGVPHAMLSSRENPNSDARTFLQTIAVRFLLSGIGVDSVS